MVAPTTVYIPEAVRREERRGCGKTNDTTRRLPQPCVRAPVRCAACACVVAGRCTRAATVEKRTHVPHTIMCVVRYIVHDRHMHARPCRAAPAAAHAHAADADLRLEVPSRPLPLLLHTNVSKIQYTYLYSITINLLSTLSARIFAMLLYALYAELCPCILRAHLSVSSSSSLAEPFEPHVPQVRSGPPPRIGATVALATGRRTGTGA
jgi:hypothetical protein